MKKNVFVILSFITLQLLACTLCSTKKVPCTSFDNNNFGTWFPYTSRLYQVFKNSQTQDTIGFQFTDIYYSPAYEVQTGGFGNRIGGCSKSATVGATAINKYINVQYYIDSAFNQPNANQQLNISISNSFFYAEEVNNQEIKKSIIDSTSNIITNTDVIFNGIFCTKLCTITNDTINNKNDRIYKIHISKGKGIIGYEYYPSLQKWIIQ